MIPPGLIAAQGRPSLGDPYAALVTGLPGGAPLAYWRFSSPAGIIDAMPGVRHGSYDGAVTLVDSLPQDSDQATHLPGTVTGTIPHDDGLELAAFSLSLWLKMPAIPGEGPAVVFSKDIPGLHNSDFMFFFFDEDLFIQFQSSSAQHRVTVSGLSPEVIYHFVVTADGSGFEIWQDGRLLESRDDFTAAWSDNQANILLGTATHISEVAEVVLDELALFDRVLSDPEIIALAQRAAAPVAGEASAVVQAAQTVVVDVAAASQYAGRKADLVITLVTQGSRGTATVTPGNDIAYAAEPTEADEADSFSYTIADANGESAPASVGITVQSTASVGGGVLVYRWTANGAWIDGVSLANRSRTAVIGVQGGQPSPNRWIDGASVGAGLVKSIGDKSNWSTNHICWNRAPDGTPALEINTVPGVHNQMDFWIYLYDNDTNAPKHLRVVMEIKTCKSDDPTTHKANGLGTKSGPYPNWSVTHSGASQAPVKYFCMQFHGGPEPFGPAGGSAGGNNWYGSTAARITGCGHMFQSGSSSKDLALYVGNFDRGSFGGGSNSTGSGRVVTSPTAKITDTGVQGVWHRLEMECKMTTPSTVPNTAVRKEGAARPSGGDGFYKAYLTKNIDGVSGHGSIGAREEVHSISGVIYAPKADEVGSDQNMHLLGLRGVWCDLYYGGSVPSQAEGWAWIRKIEVYRHD